MISPQPDPPLSPEDSARVAELSERDIRNLDEALMAEAQQHVAAEIARSGAFRAATHTGMFVCW